MIILSVNAILQGQGYTKSETDTLLATKQDTLTFDSAPGFGSLNPVRSDGIYKTRAPIYGLGKNLLRNWYFIGGGSQQASGSTAAFPINTRGIPSGTTSTTTSSTYFIDGWKTRSTPLSATITNNGIQITSTGTGDDAGKAGALLQYIENPSILLGKVVTLSALTNSGDKLYYGTSDPISIPSQTGGLLTISTQSGMINLNISGSNSATPGVIWVDIRANAGSTETFRAVKLELGTQQTLVHNEGTSNTPVWVLNEIPNFHEELARCSLSTADSDDILANGAWANLGLGTQLSYQISYSDISNLPPVTGWFNINSNATGRPSETDVSSGGVIEQIVRGSSFRYQKYYEFKNKKIFERITYNGTSGWTAWTTTHTFS